MAELDELVVLKRFAKTLDIEFSNNISLEKLQEKIGEHFKKKAIANIQVTTPQINKKTSLGDITNYLKLNKLNLIRVSIVCNDSSLLEDLHQGKIYTVYNELIGAVSHYVPISGEAAKSWHLPKIIVDFLKEKEFVQLIKNKSDLKNTSTEGSGTVKTVLKKTFTITELPPLTDEEYKKLAKKQKEEANV